VVLNHDGALLDVVSCAVYAALADMKLPNVLVQTGNNSQFFLFCPMSVSCAMHAALADMKLPNVLVQTGSSSHTVALHTTNIANIFAL
jgi:exosome complex RNA-binding protein Rrp42 (RNase PH superfamily)